MSSRFEKIIAGAVVAGALTLAGCNAGGGGGGGGNESTVAFLGGRVIDSTHLKLFFSDSISVDNAAGAADKFTLRQNGLAYGTSPSGTSICTFVQTSPSSFCGGSAYFSTALNPYHDISTDGAAIGSITDVEPSAGNPNNLILTLSQAIPDGADDGTGVLRLTYSGGSNGLSDDAGDRIAEVSLPDDVLGNVGFGSGATPGVNVVPVMVHARTIDSEQVELTFSEPVEIADGDMAAAGANFTLRENCARGDNANVYSSGLAPYNIPDYAGGFYNSSVNTYDFSTATVPLATSNAVRLILEDGTPIPDDIDHNGYLRIYYTASGSGDIQGSDGEDALGNITLASDHRGNMTDTIGDDGFCVRGL